MLWQFLNNVRWSLEEDVPRKFLLAKISSLNVSIRHQKVKLHFTFHTIVGLAKDETTWCTWNAKDDTVMSISWRKLQNILIQKYVNSIYRIYMLYLNPECLINWRRVLIIEWTWIIYWAWIMHWALI